MTSAKPHRRALCRREHLGRPRKILVIVQYQKYPIVLFIRPGLQVRRRNPDTHFSQKYHRLAFSRAQPPDGGFHVQRAADAQRFRNPCDAAGRGVFQADYAARRGLRVVQLRQPPVNFALDFGKLLLLARHGVFLRAQLFRDHGDITIAQKISNLWQRHIEGTQVTNGI